MFMCSDMDQAPWHEDSSRHRSLGIVRNSGGVLVVAKRLLEGKLVPGRLPIGYSYTFQVDGSVLNM